MTVAGKQSTVAMLGVHNVGEAFVESGGWMTGIRWPDPVTVFGAHVMVVLQQSQHGATVVTRVAMRTARLGLMTPLRPIRGGVAEFGQRPGKVLGWAVGDYREAVCQYDAPSASRSRDAELVPEFMQGQGVQ
ncbi:hypothetical protein LAUMK40_05738 [Mycobacterium kansasii]|uniref:hypothetical protein n=1 Tax=Mycobacterium kansasii TaxID=1768 RepID=UPI000F12162C|nr:hypothetical protein [Mycobacterium kansasii]VAZ69575.1 hypothetical protein LAUMK40_05738 [Mycobacterium kansasii]